MCECLFVAKRSWRRTRVSCTQRYITVSHLGSCACCHENVRARKQLLCLSTQHPRDLREHQKTRQASRGAWPPSCARRLGILSPRSFGTRKARKSATRDLRYGADMLIKCDLLVLFMQFLIVLKYCKLDWEGFSSFHFIPQRGLIECSD